MTEAIEIQRDSRGVATVHLARPEKHNAMNAAMIAGLDTAFADLGADPEIRAIVLTGQGATFCAGGDLGWMREQIAGGPPAREAGARALANMLARVDSCPKPVIGRLQGNAFGGGIGLACVCDVAIGVFGTKFGLTETRLGLIPATIGPYVVARMGQGPARRVFMSSRVFGAEEATALGILSEAVPPEDLDAAVEAEVAPYLACAPGAVAEAKALARALGGAPGAGVAPARAVDHSIEALVARWNTAEAAEGVAAFLEKRTPGWRGK